MNEKDLRDCFAMFSMVGLVMAYKDNHPETVLSERAYAIADAMLDARNKEAESIGLPPIKSRKTRSK
jgi:hypothetical protein